MPLSAGSRLGAYEIIGPLGAGGIGEVYRASAISRKRATVTVFDAITAASVSPSTSSIVRNRTPSTSSVE